MDGFVCPKLAGLLSLTQKLKAKIQKKPDYVCICPICGCKSHKGNLCQACFMRSFTPIAYTRNIKVVEQNEFFYGPGKDRRWRRKRGGGTSKNCETTDVIDKNILKMVMSSTKAFGNPLDSTDTAENSGGSELALDKDPITSTEDLPQPTSNLDHQNGTIEVVESNKLVEIDLVKVNTTTQTEETMEPLPKFVPDFWERPIEEEVDLSEASKLKTFSFQVIEEAQRPFKEIFCDSCTNVISTPGKPKNVNVLQDVLNEVQQPLSNPPQPDVGQHFDLQSRCPNGIPDAQDPITFSKQLKQNAILELLKVAYKTNIILNDLFQYFKKIVESDGSNSENSESRRQLDKGNEAADSKISVDSFFFPNRQSAILWGTGPKEPQESEAAVADEISETEVISKSQATLSMLMNRTPWSSLKDQVPFNELPECGDFIGPCPGMQCIFTASSLADRLVTRKFHSEHSKLRLKNHPDCETNEELGFQQSSIEGPDCTVGDQRNVCGNSGFTQVTSSATESYQSGKSLLDLVFGLNRSCVKPSLLPLPDCQQDLITLSSPGPSKYDILEPEIKKDADSQTALSSRHLERKMNLLHKAFSDQLAHFSIQLAKSCKIFGYSRQTTFLTELVEHFRTACNIISSFVGESSCKEAPSLDRLDQLQVYNESL